MVEETRSGIVEAAGAGVVQRSRSELREKRARCLRGADYCSISGCRNARHNASTGQLYPGWRLFSRARFQSNLAGCVTQGAIGTEQALPLLHGAAVHWLILECFRCYRALSGALLLNRAERGVALAAAFEQVKTSTVSLGATHVCDVLAVHVRSGFEREPDALRVTVLRRVMDLQRHAGSLVVTWCRLRHLRADMRKHGVAIQARPDSAARAPE